MTFGRLLEGARWLALVAVAGCSSSLQPVGQGGSGGSRTTEGAGGAPALGGTSGSSGQGGAAGAGPVSCGKTICVSGEFCCDPLCSVCAPFGSLCDLGCSVDAKPVGTCASLAAEYNQAILAAHVCTVGAPDACAAVVHASVGGDPCACDFIYVNDSTQADAIYQSAVSLGCQRVSLCGGSSCEPPPASNDRCEPVDGGAGLCHASLPGPG